MNRGDLSRLVLAIACATVFACNPGRIDGDPNDPNNPDNNDGGVVGPPSGENSAGCRGTVCKANSECNTGQRCVDGVCLVSPGACGGDPCHGVRTGFGAGR